MPEFSSRKTWADTCRRHILHVGRHDRSLFLPTKAAAFRGKGDFIPEYCLVSDIQAGSEGPRRYSPTAHATASNVPDR